MRTTIFPPQNPADDDYIRRGDLLIGTNFFYAPPDRALKTGPFVPGDWAINVEAVYNVPAADVRPVVLCRDCKYAPIGEKDGDDLEWPHNEYDGNPCPHKCSDNWYSHKPAPDFFCAAGEKREESLCMTN